MPIDQIVMKLREIQEKRTHCQCSRDKIVEKLSFDRVISLVSDCKDGHDVIDRCQAVSDSIMARNNDTLILKKAYLYAVAVAKHEQ